MTLGEKIRYARKCSGLSQEQLGEKLCVSRSAIAKWETDKGIPDVENLKMLSRLLRVSLDTLLDDREETTPVIRESYSLAAFGRGCKRVRKDRMILQRFPEARIWSLLGRPDLAEADQTPDSTLGFLTPVPFDAPEYVKNVRDLDRAFYLVEQDGEQLFVSVTDSFLQAHPLPRPQTENTFRLGDWLFIRGTCLTALTE